MEAAVARAVADDRLGLRRRVGPQHGCRILSGLQHRAGGVADEGHQVVLGRQRGAHPLELLDGGVTLGQGGVACLRGGGGRGDDLLQLALLGLHALLGGAGLSPQGIDLGRALGGRTQPAELVLLGGVPLLGLLHAGAQGIDLRGGRLGLSEPVAQNGDLGPRLVERVCGGAQQARHLGRVVALADGRQIGPAEHRGVERLGRVRVHDVARLRHGGESNDCDGPPSNARRPAGRRSRHVAAPPKPPSAANRSVPSVTPAGTSNVSHPVRTGRASSPSGRARWDGRGRYTPGRTELGGPNMRGGTAPDAPHDGTRIVFNDRVRRRRRVLHRPQGTGARAPGRARARETRAPADVRQDRRPDRLDGRVLGAPGVRGRHLVAGGAALHVARPRPRGHRLQHHPRREPRQLQPEPARQPDDALVARRDRRQLVRVAHQAQHRAPHLHQHRGRRLGHRAAAPRAPRARSEAALVPPFPARLHLAALRAVLGEVAHHRRHRPDDPGPGRHDAPALAARPRAVRPGGRQGRLHRPGRS